MHVEYRIQNTDLAEALKNYIERRLRFALGRFGDRVGQVSIQISGNASTKTELRLSAELLPFGRVAVHETDIDLFAAIDRGTGRIGRLFGRELQRIRDIRLGHDSFKIAA